MKDRGPYLTVKVWKRADSFANTNKEERWKGRWQNEPVQGVDYVVLNIQVQLLRVQKRKAEIISSAEHEDLSLSQRAILELHTPILQDPA